MASLAGSPRLRRLLLLAGLALIGGIGGMVLAGRTSAAIGPFDATVALRAGTGDTRVELPPLGSLRFDTHDGPVGLRLRANELRPDAARAAVENPDSLRGLEDEAADDIRTALRTVVARGALGAFAGALGLVLLRELSRRAAATAAAIALSIVVVSGGTAAVTWEANSIGEPRYTGLLAAAPRAVGSVRDIQARFDAYRDQLSALIRNVSGLYETAASLEALEADSDTVRILHVSDLHLNPQGFDLIEQTAKQFKVDAVVDTGDIVDWGTGLESRFTDAIGRLKVPYVFVRGNHDSGDTAAAVAGQANAVVLDRDVTEVDGIRIWGAGDPRFTPDKSSGGKDEEPAAMAAFAARIAADLPDDVDVVLVHDPAGAVRLGGKTPLVLAGHQHRPRAREIKPAKESLPQEVDVPLPRTRMLIQGSTGGAGLRALEGKSPAALSASVLHFDAGTRRLAAYDQITVSGLGGSQVSIQRHLVPSELAPEPDVTTTVALRTTRRWR